MKKPILYSPEWMRQRDESFNGYEAAGMFIALCGAFVLLIVVFSL